MSILKSKTSRTQFLASLRDKMQRESNGSKGAFQRQDDERFWRPELDKTGTGSAVIRFLPAKEGEPFPYVQLYSHGFQGPNGKWFIENCPTSLENDCPACKANSALWQSGSEANKKLASSRKRKLNYISNVLVINDPKHPENNGKVVLFKFGKKIFDKIKELIDPPAEFADMDPVNAFCPFEGANFKLRITRQDNFPNYDMSKFDGQTAMFDGDEDKINALLQTVYSLEDILDPKKFKTFDDLKKRFDQVTGEAEDATPAQRKPADPPFAVTPPKAAMTAAPKPVGRTTAPKVEDDDSDDFFANLTRQDDYIDSH